MLALLTGFAACETVDIVAVDVASIEVEPAEFSIAVGERRTVSAALLDEAGNPITGYDVSWSSNNPDVAIVGNNGVVRAIGEGVAEISARVNGTAGNAVVTVIEGPSVGLSPQAVTFAATIGSAPPAARTVRVTNAGPGTLDGLTTSIDYAAGQPSGWLTAALDGTTAPTNLRLTVAPGSMTAGSYEASVTIESSHPGAAPRVLPVELIIGDPLPVIELETDQVSLTMVAGGANPPARTIAVTNVGGGTLSGLGAAVTYTAGQPSGWLSASLSPSTAPATLVLNINGGALQPGTYTADVAVVAPGAANSPRTIDVTLVVQLPPRIALSTGSRTFTAPAGGPDPAAQTVLINNAGGGTLSGLEAAIVHPNGQPTGWLSADLNGTTAPATATLRAAVGSLAPGTYSAALVISAPGASNSPQTVQVSLVVTAPPASIALSQETVTFQATTGGANPSPAQIQITNAGGGTLSGLAATVTYAQGQTGGWLSATSSGTTAPATLTLQATTGALPAGTYNAIVAVAANGASNTPQNVSVTFQVQPVANPPAAPTNLRTDVRSEDRIDLRWNDNSSNETHFVVQRSIVAGLIWTFSEQVPANTTVFSHRGLEEDTRYWFRVLACNANGCSVSEVVDARTKDD